LISLAPIDVQLDVDVLEGAEGASGDAGAAAELFADESDQGAVAADFQCGEAFELGAQLVEGGVGELVLWPTAQASVTTVQRRGPG
jgi:hypothetical protein